MTFQNKDNRPCNVLYPENKHQAMMAIAGFRGVNVSVVQREAWDQFIVNNAHEAMEFRKSLDNNGRSV